jgi:hypothetical protein
MGNLIPCMRNTPSLEIKPAGLLSIFWTLRHPLDFERKCNGKSYKSTINLHYITNPPSHFRS